MKTCKNCNKEIVDNSLFCPYCGNKCDTNDSPSENVDESISDFEQDIERKRKITRIATIALPILILVIGGYFLLNRESETIIESPSDKQQQVDSVDEEIAEEEDENDIESQLSKISYNRINKDSLCDFLYVDRYVLYNGENVKYKPGTTTADLEVFAIKEAILILTYNSIFSDPEFSGDSTLIDNVFLHNPPKTSAKTKAAVEEHYNASVSNYFKTEQPLFLHQAKSEYSGHYNYVFYPLDKDEKYEIEFHFDNNKRLIVDTHKDWRY